jgi:hypothetical protein
LKRVRLCFVFEQAEEWFAICCWYPASCSC